ncbi:MAG TPA: hypothetical protein VLC08_08270 [Chitinolyticbacter sp.]|nr:hypothetical protein [Chitinolyticbacter sp.]
MRDFFTLLLALAIAVLPSRVAWVGDVLLLIAGLLIGGLLVSVLVYLPLLTIDRCRRRNAPAPPAPAPRMLQHPDSVATTGVVPPDQPYGTALARRFADWLASRSGRTFYAVHPYACEAGFELQADGGVLYVVFHEGWCEVELARFNSSDDFAHWLAQQSDQSLAAVPLGNPVSRSRIEAVALACEI